MEKQSIDYSRYRRLSVEKKDGIAIVTLNGPKVLNVADRGMHNELSRIWLDLDRDAEVRVALVTGQGDAFSAGGDFALIEEMKNSPRCAKAIMKEAKAIVINMIKMEKPTVSAINGVAIGAGLAVALTADIPIASERAKFSDGHIRLGLAAGDHAVLIWPLRAGMAKTKYYLLTSDFFNAREAEAMHLVSMVVPHDQLMSKSMAIAQKLSFGPQPAIIRTRRALNKWYKLGIPAFIASVKAETMTFSGDDLPEGLKALREKRVPQFPSAMR